MNKINKTDIMELGTREHWEKNKPKDYGESECVLCTPEQTPILWRGKHFYICRNKYPYLGLKDHIMAVPYRHVSHTTQLTDEEFCDYKNVEVFVKEYFQDQEYFSFIRESIGGKSLSHVHYHFLPGVLYASNLEEMLKQQGF